MLKNILVTGATGQQGGALVDALLANSKSSWKIYALTRDSKSPSAQQLVKKGGESIELVEGDLDNKEFLDAFVQRTKDLYAVFSVQAANYGPGGAQMEIEQGIRLADAAKKANVKHFVYTSVAGSNQKSGVVSFDSKFEIEEHIRKIELPYTILRPMMFMDNVKAPGFQVVLGGFYKYQMSPSQKLQMISVHDIGHFAFLALQNPAVYLGKDIDIAGDELTFEEANEIWKRHNAGQDIPSAVEWQVEAMTPMFDWIARVGYKADIPRLRKLYPELSNFDGFLGKTKETH